jgi:hypothetical protein
VGFAELDSAIQAAVGRMSQIAEKSSEEIEILLRNDENIISAVRDAASDNTRHHDETRTQINEAASSLQNSHVQTRQELATVGSGVSRSVMLASDINVVQHEATRAEITRIRDEAERQVSQLREEIRLLKIEIEESIKTVVASVGNVSTREERRLRELSNAKFNVWVAKEVILKKLLVSLYNRVGF